MQGRQQTVLWVEDNQVVRDLGRHHLEGADFEVFSAEDGSAALDILSRQAIDVVLLDLRLPGIDGLEVLRRIRRTSTARQLPILVVTSTQDSASMVEAFQLGANDYITKPLDWPVLRARMQAQLRTGKSATEVDRRLSGSARIQIPGYHLEQLIGHGARSKVYRGRQHSTGHPVAIKSLPPDAPLPRPFDHPHAVRVLADGRTASGHGYIIMELLEGITLEEEIGARGPCSLERCRTLLTPVCAALAAAHQGQRIHGDVKPQNIFLHRGEGREVVKLIDFGLADDLGVHGRPVFAPDEGPHLTVSGTPAYMAPECFSDAPCDHRMDIYSLGVTLYEMLTGSLPFHIADGNVVRLAKMHMEDTVPPVSAKRQDLPPWIDGLIARAMAKDPADRPPVGGLASSLAPSSSLS